MAQGESTLTFGAFPKLPLTLTLSKLSDAFTDLGFGVDVGVDEVDGLAEVGVAAGDAAAGSAAGLSLLQPKRSSKDDASPTATVTLSGVQGTGEGYRLNPSGLSLLKSPACRSTDSGQICGLSSSDRAPPC